MPSHKDTQLPTLTSIFEFLKQYQKENERIEHLEQVVESKELTRDAFFNEASWAILVSGVTAKAASTNWDNASNNGFPLGYGNWKTLAEWCVEDFNEWCKRMARSLKQPKPDLDGKFRDKWWNIWDLAEWLAEFLDDNDFQNQIFAGKTQGEQLNKNDVNRLAQIKTEQPRLYGLGRTNLKFILRNLGGNFLKPDVWINTFCIWYDDVNACELASLLTDEGIHCGRFDAYFWNYCEQEIGESRFLNEHFDDLFLSNTELSDRVRLKEFEEQVWNLEGIRIVVRAPSTKRTNPYNYLRKAQYNWNVAKWLQDRIGKFFDDEVDVIVISGTGHITHGATQLRTVRESYEE